MENIDEKALFVAKDDSLLSEFIIENQRFIMNCAYQVTHRYITKSDDEWSISLIAFTNAIQSYDSSKCHFLSYAELLIRHSLIDYYRTQKKFQSEIQVSPYLFEFSNNMEDSTNPAIQIDISQKLSKIQNDQLHYEIQAATTAFQAYGFTFFDLAKCSPKSRKTKQACKTIILFLLSDPTLLHQMYATKQVPIKIIQKNTELPRKIIEHHRKYIIAVILLLSGEYPLMAEYISYIRKEDI